MPAPTLRSRLGAVAAVAGFLGVTLGAFGAHGLKDVLDADGVRWWQTGAQYHQIHAVLAVVAALVHAWRPSRAARVSAVALLVGVALFSGSLYMMALTGIRVLGAVTPFGGVAFLVGWAALAVALGGRGAGIDGARGSQPG